MKLKWNLRMMMVQHDIRSAAELMRLLNNHGIKISSAQTTRIVNEMPSRISTNILRGLLEIFKCTANDLIVVEHDPDDNKPTGSNVRNLHQDQNPVTQNKRPVSKPEPNPVTDIASITGGNTRTFPIKGRDET